LAAWVADGGGWDIAADERERVLAVLPDAWARAAARWPGSFWDLSPAEHRRAFTWILQEDGGCSPALATSLYDSMPNQWQLAQGVAPLFTRLCRDGIRIGIVSNIAIDIRPVLDQWGLLGQLDAVVLSFEVGMVKPDPAIFLLAAAAIDRHPAECLMVGDSPAIDGAASRVGMRSLIVAKGDAGPRLDAVAPLCGLTPT
jgi:FMN phosphatase YigB (HAD superfamily)